MMDRPRPCRCGRAGEEDFSYEKSSQVKNLRTKIFRRRPSADHPHMAGVAQDDVLPGDFDRVKAAASDFGFKGVAPDFAVDGADRAADDATVFHRFCGKHGFDPCGVVTERAGCRALVKGGGAERMLHEGQSFSAV